jgi:hypothetical protein
MLAALCGLGLILVKPWDKQMCASAAQWVREHPEIVVTERQNGTVSKVYDMPHSLPVASLDMIRQRNFDALVPVNSVLYVMPNLSAKRIWLTYQTLQDTAVGTVVDCIAPSEYPPGVAVNLTEIRVTSDKIESVYQTSVSPVSPWEVLALGFTVFLVLGLGWVAWN